MRKIKIQVFCQSTNRKLYFPTIFYLDDSDLLVSYKFEDLNIIDLSIPNYVSELFVTNKGYHTKQIVINESINAYIVKLQKNKRNDKLF